MESKGKNNALKLGLASLGRWTENKQGLQAGCYLPNVSRDNNLYVVGDISKKCLDTTETNNYQMRAKDV